MGELLLCNEPIAALPFYVEGMGVNLYSMEELCYYIAYNTYLLDRSFMSEELCAWVEQQLGLYKLAEQLRNTPDLPHFVEAILNAAGYYGPKESSEIVLLVRQMEEKTDFECSKLKADRLIEKEKYVSSIYEYQRLLESEDAKTAGGLIVGAIWHNLGTAYARLFLFAEAIRCYNIAYDLNLSDETLKACLLCYRCMHDEEGFLKKAEKHHMDEAQIQALKEELSALSRSDQTVAFEERLNQIAAMNADGEKALARQEISDIILEWKEEYRRSCRM